MTSSTIGNQALSTIIAEASKQGWFELAISDPQLMTVTNIWTNTCRQLKHPYLALLSDTPEGGVRLTWYVGHLDERASLAVREIAIEASWDYDTPAMLQKSAGWIGKLEWDTARQLATRILEAVAATRTEEPPQPIQSAPTVA